MEQEIAKATPERRSQANSDTNWRGALKDLRIDTEKKAQVGPEDGELTPDSMSSRLADSAIALNDKKMDDFAFDRMGSRVSTFAA